MLRVGARGGRGCKTVPGGGVLLGLTGMRRVREVERQLRWEVRSVDHGCVHHRLQVWMSAVSLILTKGRAAQTPTSHGNVSANLVCHHVLSSTISAGCRRVCTVSGVQHSTSC